MSVQSLQFLFEFLGRFLLRFSFVSLKYLRFLLGFLGGISSWIFYCESSVFTVLVWVS